MSVALGELGAEASMCHLMTHASFKSALFLAAGVVIQACNGNQHMSAKTRVSNVMTPTLCLLTLLVGSLSLVGWPELSGFYSKETILNLATVFFHPASDFAHTLLLVTALLTSIYTCKLWLSCFTSLSNKQESIADVLPGIACSVLLLDIALKVWVGTNLVSSASSVLLFLSWSVKTMPLGAVLAGIMCAAAGVASQEFALIRFCGTRWGFDQMYARCVVLMFLDWGRITWSVGDRGLFSVIELRAHM